MAASRSRLVSPERRPSRKTVAATAITASTAPQAMRIVVMVMAAKRQFWAAELTVIALLLCRCGRSSLHSAVRLAGQLLHARPTVAV